MDFFYGFKISEKAVSYTHLDVYKRQVPVYDQLVLAEFIDNGDFERHINRVRRRRRKKSGNYF